MEKTILIDHLHVVLRIPDGLPEEELDDVRRALSGDGLADQVLVAVRIAIQSLPELGKVWVSITR